MKRWLEWTSLYLVLICIASSAEHRTLMLPLLTQSWGDTFCTLLFAMLGGLIFPSLADALHDILTGETP
jgi:hypothetical protein